MKHSEEYLLSKEVVKNHKNYDYRDVKEANDFIRGYEEALNICDVSDLLKSYNDYLYVKYNGTCFDNLDVKEFIKRFL